MIQIKLEWCGVTSLTLRCKKSFHSGAPWPRGLCVCLVIHPLMTAHPSVGCKNHQNHHQTRRFPLQQQVDSLWTFRICVLNYSGSVTQLNLLLLSAADCLKRFRSSSSVHVSLTASISLWGNHIFLESDIRVWEKLWFSVQIFIPQVQIISLSQS